MVNYKTVWGLATTLFTKNVLVFKNYQVHLRNQSFRWKSAKRTLKTSARYQDRAHSVIPDEREYCTHHLAALRGSGEFFIFILLHVHKILCIHRQKSANILDSVIATRSHPNINTFIHPNSHSLQTIPLLLAVSQSWVQNVCHELVFTVKYIRKQSVFLTIFKYLEHCGKFYKIWQFAEKTNFCLWAQTRKKAVLQFVCRFFKGWTFF